MRWLSRLVSISVMLAVLAIVVLWMRSRIPDLSVGGGFITHAKFRDGSRLAIGSPVVIAGVRIGDVTRISIEGQFARVDMRLRDDVQLPADSFATRRADSLFGDSYVEIIPGTHVQVLRSGEPVIHMEEGASTDSMLRAMGTALPKIDNALDSVHRNVVRSRQVVQGPVDDRLVAAGDWLAEGHIEPPLTATDRALERLETATARAADALAGAAPGVTAQLQDLDAAIASARQSMADGRTGLARAMQRARDGLDAVDPTVAQMAEVMIAIDRGETNDWRGSLGRLVNDPSLHDTLEEATVGAEEAVHGFNRFRSWLGARVELGAYSKAFRFYATAEVRARNDKFYLVEFEKSGLGGVPGDALTDVPGSGGYTRTQEIRDKLRFTAQFGKQFGLFQLRGGLKDSTFGFGGDVLLSEGRLRLSADLFGSFQRTPRLKLAAAFAMLRSIYVVAGIDDALNAPGTLPIVPGGTPVPVDFREVHHGRDFFIGAALHFNDADLATLLRVYGAVLVGLLTAT
ncbi:MAG TPA: MlaD family protein [Kofleriaceae bacterium]|nr:MlaD family protein [Kofleriaceae bacterium]